MCEWAFSRFEVSDLSKIPRVKEPELPNIDIVLIDGDVLRYEIGAVTLDHPYVPGAKVPAPLNFVEDLVRDRIKGIKERTNAKKVLIYLTGPENFRFDIAKQQPYKGNRADFEKPFHWKTVDKLLRREYPFTVSLGNEADDELGIKQMIAQYAKEAEYWANILGITPHELVTCIASRDKDLRTVPGYHYSWACGENQPEKPLRYISKLEANRFFFQQMLTGDSTDHIIGCGRKYLMMWGGSLKLRRKGVGETAAKKLLAKLETVQEMYDAVKAEYLKVYGTQETEAALLENAQLLFIGQRTDHRFQWDWLQVNHQSGVTIHEDVQWFAYSNSASVPFANVRTVAISTAGRPLTLSFTGEKSSIRVFSKPAETVEINDQKDDF